MSIGRDIYHKAGLKCKVFGGLHRHRAHQSPVDLDS